MRLESTHSEEGRDQLGKFTSQVFTYSDQDGPIVRQQLKTYEENASLAVEATALRDLQGTALTDSFFNTTFNAPVIRLAEGFKYIAYTWGLRGEEGTGIGGNFPDAAIALGLDQLPEMLRQADFSATDDVHQTGAKPFAPLIGYNDDELTMVMSPLDHFLISPLRLISTPKGMGVARGLHGSVDFIPSGTTTGTVMVFGQGLVSTLTEWGDLLLGNAGKRRSQGRESFLAKKLGFWNCYGSYYADLFRPTTASTLTELSAYFKEEEIPVSYLGLDLWYPFEEVGFARSYRPDPDKYPQGLGNVSRETGLPLQLHMSAFALENEYRDDYEFVSEEGSAYPVSTKFYRDRAKEFKEWGAMGVWTDFLRTQLQNSFSLRSRIGAADQWFSGMCEAMSEEELEVMLCMPTMGHYLGSTAHDNVTAVRTSTDYLNHQPGQLELLRRYTQEFRIANTPQNNLRQNLLLSLVAAALDLTPSFDVFITNSNHPEGFSEKDAHVQSLARALSSGVVGIGDRAGYVDKEIIARLAFPDGTLAQPDHPLYPVVSTLQSDVMAFHTTTSLGDLKWTYLALFNLEEGTRSYQVDLDLPFIGPKAVVYDYSSGQLISERKLEGELGSMQVRYLVIAPTVGKLAILGFIDKYVTLSGRQVKSVISGADWVELALELPIGRSYTFVVVGEGQPSADGQGITVEAISRAGRQGLRYIRFQVESSPCSLLIRATGESGQMLDVFPAC